MPSLQHELGKKKPFESPEQETYLNLLRTVSVLSVAFQRLFRSHGLSEATYNALRILRGSTSSTLGSAPAPRPCHHIAEQLVTQVPDVTRLVDRLESMGLAERTRCEHDRRVVYVRITPKGLEVLAALDGPTMDLHRAQLGHMKPDELRELSDLLVRAREAHAAANLNPAR